MPDRPPTSYFTGLSDEALASLGSMEGLHETPVVRIRPATSEPTPKRPSPMPGYIAVGAVAALGFILHVLPFAPFTVAGDGDGRHPISAATLAILSGVLVRNLVPVSDRFVEGCRRTVRRLVPLTIVLSGAGIDMLRVASVGGPAIFMAIVAIGLGTASAYLIGRALGVWPRTSLLIGVGTGICGTNAIVAAAPLVEARDEDVTLAAATINVVGLIMMFSFPLIGSWAGMSDQTFGVWTGLSIHAVAQVIAAGFGFSNAAGSLAALVKLVRVTLLAPYVLLLAILYARRRRDSRVEVSYGRLVPTFLWGFLAFALLNTLGFLPVLEFTPAFAVLGIPERFQFSASNFCTELGNLVLTFSMAALGLEVSLRFMLSVGIKALITGLASAALLSLVSLGLIRWLL
ncbi:MAG: putative sulfate exporter family transporter [Acidobacteria bacterium]|nr:putative sulfate exporter family transporter [Acidobacteriota bacterium]